MPAEEEAGGQGQRRLLARPGLEPGSRHLHVLQVSERRLRLSELFQVGTYGLPIQQGCEELDGVP